jgi:hypothetical protein
MILLLSGEGTSDIGTCRTAAKECEGSNFKPGPMAWVVDKLVEPLWNYSPLASGSCVFISEHSLAQHCRKRVGITLPGRKRPIETGYFFKNARGLAQLAKARSKRDQCPVGAVLFRDSDGTVASVRSLWNDKVTSMESGFAAEDFEFGVPMVPKPKSEAWLLCAAQASPYQNCVRFESLSGNDASPKSAKAALEKALTTRGRSHVDLCDMIEKGDITPQRIDMPSFHRFRERLEKIAHQMLK